MWRHALRPTRPRKAAPARPALMFTNNERETTRNERLGSCTGWNKEWIITVTNDYTGFIAFRGIICMNITSLFNNPFTVINKTEIG